MSKNEHMKRLEKEVRRLLAENQQLKAENSELRGAAERYRKALVETFQLWQSYILGDQSND